MSKLILGVLLSLFLFNPKNNLPDSKLAKDVRIKIWPKLQSELGDKGLDIKSDLYLRIFKDETVMEIWIKSGREYQFFKSYNICYFSGGLGTKTRSGDGKSPEGFYAITPGQLYPLSTYYLAINIGYPNKLEKLKGYTGDAIMIHGHCASIGCYAMTNDGIEEIYTLVYKNFEAGRQKIQLDIFPFRMNPEHLKKYAASSYLPFWKSMKPGYDLFEKNHIPAVAAIKNQHYIFNH
ncbi:L,D-transpeptidase family protein [Mucilaginibacter gotjawali]|uniref:L,D-transpeptidase catalytic domain n=2 Tax=Mucilaginibacter gotjawali TaxID=1550579 RepID=A0A120MYI1_9SPHI|nr:L,D-transpeptidase family protein [Mucilaginibacter gotjawali]MBB3055649.1 murein L,D-transpeptidase YafK [Mucilaginibacter gotjawali]BAU53066.1 L,D-transpeptidase catalytic domain [Mucilaginibacter gotjawali]